MKSYMQIKFGECLYYSVQNILPFCLLSKDLKIQTIYNFTLCFDWGHPIVLSNKNIK